MHGRPPGAAPEPAQAPSTSTSASATGAARPGEGPRRVVVLLRNDLRTRDNAVLHEAARRCAGGAGAAKYDEALLVYFFDPRTYALNPYGDLKTGKFR